MYINVNEKRTNADNAGNVAKDDDGKNDVSLTTHLHYYICDMNTNLTLLQYNCLLYPQWNAPGTVFPYDCYSY